MTSLSITLTPEEQAIYDGSQGEVMQKVMRSVVLYGEAFGADRLVPISGQPHLVTSFGSNTTTPFFDMLDELISAGLKTAEPFTVDPRPCEFESLDPGLMKRLSFKLIFGKQADYEKQLAKLGLRDEQAFSCACYLPEMGNAPQRGQVLAWSESSAVVYANSVLGARTNRNSAGIDLMCDVLGKAPRFGLLTDEGRRASWRVDVRTTGVPNPQLLGSVIGLKVMEDVPYITGLDILLGEGLPESTAAYLKDMGAASASNGAVGLYHVEGITPEASDQGRDLLKSDAQVYIIDDAELERIMRSYPVLWKDVQATPKRVFIGCPHLTRHQVEDWTDRFEQALAVVGQEQVHIPVYLFTPPPLADALRKDAAFSERLQTCGLRLISICPLMYMNNPLCAGEPIVTNSNKLRTYTGARFFLDDDVITIAVTGRLPQGGNHA
jgi:predicted aconitase